MYPNDALTVKTTVAVTSDVVLIPTTTTQITILNAHMDKVTQASQLLQCNVNGGAPFTTFIQAIGTTSQDINGHWVLPVNSVCKLRTFDATLTSGYLTYVPYNLASTTMQFSSIPTSTPMQNIYNEMGIISMVIVVGILFAVLTGYLVKKLT